MTFGLVAGAGQVVVDVATVDVVSVASAAVAAVVGSAVAVVVVAFASSAAIVCAAVVGLVEHIPLPCWMPNLDSVRKAVIKLC